MIVITGVYMLNQALFTHKHIAEDGTVVTHAHPYDRSDSGPYKHHIHSRAELIVFDSAKTLFFVPALLFVAAVLQPVQVLPIYQRSAEQQYAASPGNSRAPPTLF